MGGLFSSPKPPPPPPTPEVDRRSAALEEQERVREKVCVQEEKQERNLQEH